MTFPSTFQNPLRSPQNSTSDAPSLQSTIDADDGRVLACPPTWRRRRRFRHPELNALRRSSSSRSPRIKQQPGTQGPRRVPPRPSWTSYLHVLSDRASCASQQDSVAESERPVTCPCCSRTHSRRLWQWSEVSPAPMRPALGLPAQGPQPTPRSLCSPVLPHPCCRHTPDTDLDHWARPQPTC